MNSKKLFAATMASAIALSLAVPAFAASSTTITSTYEEVPIEVAVPASAVVKINPYGLPTTFYFTEAGKVSSKHVDGGTDVSVPGSTFATQPMMLINYGQADLDVSAGITITESSGIVFDANEAKGSKVDKKYVELYVEAGTVSPGFADAIEADGHEVPLSAIAASWSSFTWGAGQGNPVVTTGTGKTAKSEAAEAPLGTLAKTEEITAEGADKGKMAVTDGGIMPIRLNGTVTKKPTTAWEAGDSFNGTITYSFEIAQAGGGEVEEGND